MSGCWPYPTRANPAPTPHCGKHCTHVDDQGRPCVLEPHEGDVHVKATPPCDPNAAIKFARSPWIGPRGEHAVYDRDTGHRWVWNFEHYAWEDRGPL